MKKVLLLLFNLLGINGIADLLGITPSKKP